MLLVQVLVPAKGPGYRQSVEVDFGAIGATVGPGTDVSLAVVDMGAFPVAFGAGVATGEGTVLPHVPGPNVGVDIGAFGMVTAVPAVVTLEVVTDVDAGALVGAGEKRWPL